MQQQQPKFKRQFLRFEEGGQFKMMSDEAPKLEEN